MRRLSGLDNGMWTVPDPGCDKMTPALPFVLHMRMWGD
ncbi:hypothetical protein SHLA_12c000450 [Shinella sp. DD12]|jgi:hypothetical protein|nr:hypothetical protein SHLA_12c000450 [Shinella sp. DD12]